MKKGILVLCTASMLSACGGGSSIVNLSSEKISIKVNDCYGYTGGGGCQPAVHEASITELSVEAKIALITTTVVERPLNCVNDGITYDITVTSKDGEESEYFSNNKACNDITGQQFVRTEKVESLIEMLKSHEPDDKPEGLSIEQGVYGTVTAESDVGDPQAPAPIGGFNVNVMTITESNGTSKPASFDSVDFQAITDENGFYEIEMPPGQYCVCTMSDRCTGITLSNGTEKLDYVFGVGPGWETGVPGC